MGRAAAFFDLDKTVIARSSALAFGRPFYAHGLISRTSVLQSTVAQFIFLAGGADHDQMERLRANMTAMVTGWDVQQVRDIVEDTLSEIIQPYVYAEAMDLFAEHHAAGRDVAIVSSSAQEIVRPISEMIGADRVAATRATVADGRYTGEIEFYCYGEGKAQALADLAEQHGYDLAASYAYSDSVTDIPMLAAVGHPFAVNPDRGLRAAAAERGWPVLEFRHPVPRFARLQRMARRRRWQAGLALGSLAAVALVVLARRRSRG